MERGALDVRKPALELGVVEFMKVGIFDELG
jgi:hypothetical protein